MLKNFKRPYWMRPAFLGFLFTLAAVEFARGALFISILPIFITDKLHYSVAVSGLVISAHYLMDTVFKSPLGVAVDRLGSRRVLIVGLPLALASILIFSFARAPWLLVLAGAMFGLGAAPTWPSVVSSALELSPQDARAATMSTVFVAWLVGSGLGTVSVNFLIKNTYYYAFLAVGVIFALGLAVALIQHMLHLGKEPVRENLSFTEQWKAITKHLASIRVLIPGMFVQTLSLGMLLPILAPYARIHLGLNQAHYGYLLMLGGGVTVLLLLPFGQLADKFNYRWVLGTSFVVAAASLVGLTHRVGLAGTLALACILGASYSMILPAWNGLLTRALPESVRGTLIGIFMSVEGLGTASGPILGAKLWSAFGPRSPFFVSATVLVVMAVFYLVYPIPIGQTE